MKFVVAVDLEGVACAYGPMGESIESAFNIEFVRKQLQKRQMRPFGGYLPVALKK